MCIHDSFLNNYLFFFSVALNNPPLISCMNDFSIKVDAGAPGTLVPFDAPTCFDQNQPSQTLSLSCNPMTNNFLLIGQNLVTCTCIDNSGDIDTCSFTVNVFGKLCPLVQSVYLFLEFVHSSHKIMHKLKTLEKSCKTDAALKGNKMRNERVC